MGVACVSAAARAVDASQFGLAEAEAAGRGAAARRPGGPPSRRTGPGGGGGAGGGGGPGPPPRAAGRACPGGIGPPAVWAPAFGLVGGAAVAPADATPFDMRGVELGHHRGECSFEAFLRRYALDDPI